MHECTKFERSMNHIATAVTRCVTVQGTRLVNALKERRNVALNTAETAVGNASYGTVMCNLVKHIVFQF